MAKKKGPEPVEDIEISVELLNSKAFRSLNKNSIFVYFDMRIKRKEKYNRYKHFGKPITKKNKTFHLYLQGS